MGLYYIRQYHIGGLDGAEPDGRKGLGKNIPSQFSEQFFMFILSDQSADQYSKTIFS